MRTQPLTVAGLILAALWLAGCSTGTAYVDRQVQEGLIEKPKLAGSTGEVTVCHGSDTPQAEIDALAKEACAYWGLEAEIQLVRKWQCSFTAPHSSSYACIDRSMRFSNGSYVNPFNKAAVENWRDEQLYGPRVYGRKARAARDAERAKAAPQAPAQ